MTITALFHTRGAQNSDGRADRLGRVVGRPGGRVLQRATTYTLHRRLTRTTMRAIIDAPEVTVAGPPSEASERARRLTPPPRVRLPVVMCVALSTCGGVHSSKEARLLFFSSSPSSLLLGV